jgi:hypothetical protein
MTLLKDGDTSRISAEYTETLWDFSFGDIYMLIKWVLLSRKRNFFITKYLDFGISSAVPAFLLFLLKWEISRNVNFRIIKYKIN